MIKVLFAPPHQTPMSEMLPLAIALHERCDDIQPVFLLGHEPLRPYITQLRNADIPVHTTHELLRDPPPQPPPVKVLGRERRAWLGHSITEIIRGLAYIRIEKRLQKAVHQTLNQIQPDRLLLYGDRTFGVEAHALKWARDHNIPTAVLPIVPFMNEKFPAKLRKNNPAFNASESGPWINRRIAAKHPNQVWESEDGAKALCYRAGIVITRLRMDMLPPNPWVNGDSFADQIWVMGDYAKQDLIRKNVNPDKIKITGQFSLDTLHHAYIQRETRRADYAEQYNLDPSKNWISLALPQLAEHGTHSLEQHWNEINHLLTQLTSLRAQVLISLHPKMDSARYAYLENEYPIKIIQQRLYEFLPTTQLFIAAFDSTIYWAAAACVPSVLLGYLDFQYDVSRFQTVTNALDRDSIAQICLNWMTKPNHDFKSEQKSLPLFDGKAFERITNLIRNPTN